LCLEHVETLGAYRIPRRPAFSSHLINAAGKVSIQQFQMSGKAYQASGIVW
jgi:hypothetical protein